MSYFSEHKRGILGSGIIHLIILLLLLWLGFFTPLPLPGEEGILVNFGTSEQGLGEKEPSPALNTPPVVKEEKKEEEVIPPPPVKTIPPIPKPQPKSQPKEEIMTQDYEKTVAIDAAEKKRKEEADKIKKENAEKERKRLEDAKIERQRLEEIERQKLAEIERLRQEESERQRLAELERQRQAEVARKINEINSRTKGAFEKSGNGSGGTGTDNGKSQGATYPGGNQGVPTGTAGAPNYGQGGTGTSNQGTGISYSLAGRSARSMPKPNYPGNEEGIVVVNVTVDKYGNVTKAEAGARGSTTINTNLLAAAQKAALQAKFNLDNNAPAFQTGTITYKFSLE